jgi:hypothetical protein
MFSYMVTIFSLRTGNDGIICALGWIGGWFAEFAHDGTGKTKVMGGENQFTTHRTV